MLNDILKIILSSFLIGCISEGAYRSIKQQRLILPKLINVQMYILTGIFLYILYMLGLSLILKIFLILLFTTGREYLTGYLYLKYKKIRLRDYSDQRVNYKGLICPLFSFYRLAIALAYNFFLLPWIVKIF